MLLINIVISDDIVGMKFQFCYINKNINNSFLSVKKIFSLITKNRKTLKINPFNLNSQSANIGFLISVSKILRITSAER